MNHAAYIEKTKTMCEASLRYVIQDCQQVLEANPDGRKAGYYLDEISYCGMELKRRQDAAA